MTLSAILRSAGVAILSWSHPMKVNRRKKRVFVGGLSERLTRMLSWFYDIRRSKSGRLWIQWRHK
jgi:hypothetical protein